MREFHVYPEHQVYGVIYYPEQKVAVVVDLEEHEDPIHAVQMAFTADSLEEAIVKYCDWEHELVQQWATDEPDWDYEAFVTGMFDVHEW